MTRWLIAVGIGLALIPVIHAQDGLRSASLPERPIATAPPGPADLFRATPNTYRPRNRPLPPRRPLDGRGAGPVHPANPISGVDGPRRRPRTGWGYWPSYYSSYWPYYPDDPEPSDNQPAVEREAPADGRLQLRVAPGDASVYVDGEYEGTADDLREPGTLLRAGTHRVRLEASGYASYTFDVRIGEGETATRRATLDREAAPGTVAPRLLTGVAPPSVKTMYVIPRCYAGDKPPDPATHCDLTQLRTIR
jgi:hypothetical protein